ncbi:MAG: FtsW/RodA/SpoVE family cell cycle protein, partial [Clostridiales bacterium]
GLTGVGLGSGGAKWFYLPDRHTDFIFSIFAEELGLIGGIILFLLFLAFTWRGLAIAWNASDSFGSLLALGLTSMVTIQALMNLGVALGCLPVTGITLPFISYGGTSLVISLGAIGVLLNVSRYANLRR